MSEFHLVARCAPLMLASMVLQEPLTAQATIRQAGVVTAKDAAAPAAARLERMQRLATRVDSMSRALTATLSPGSLQLTDTVRVGAFTLLTTPDLRTEVRQAAE